MSKNIRRFAMVVGVGGLFLVGAGGSWADSMENRLELLGLQESDIADQGLPENWKPVFFPKISQHTRYRIVKDGDVIAVEANADRSASGIIREIEYSVSEFPILQWSWKISSVYERGDFTKKSGDDYPARVYITFDSSGVELSWWEKLQVKSYELIYGETPPLATLSYIWANRGKVGTIVDNPYTGRVKMVLVNSGNDQAGRWVSQERNLREDFVAAFGYEPPPVSAIAIMTDGDNTQSSTTSWYGALRAVKSP
ncbi:hypothetical protein BTA51_18915 [Hahella sp. CCB-MM4]|uniref:DUF3047 domain-containing protein n=1 Tax=Hahella sp. (strain CCB-MM4) TaxID=1926491 RepID=UPI000B9A94F4|nr:DUF3047 domain-containing protein [Hahella sp. CCB-MM4]OZG71716.1 hypothetical protein BTA51_18915 [Hahella sp. CCB-MM4]